MTTVSEQITTGNFTGANGLQLYSKVWLPGQPPKAILVIVHGAGEHIDRYPNLVQGLVPAGYALAGFDQRGHGRSPGQRGHIDSWNEYRQDLDAFLSVTRRLAPGLPLFVYGHSMGSLIVLDYLIDHSNGLAGAIISGTALEPADAAPPFLKMLAQALSGIYPRFSLQMKLAGSSLSRDPKVAIAYNKEDPMVHYDRSARWGAEILHVIQRIKNHAAQIQLPVLFLHGELDPLLAVAGARACATLISSTDKTVRIYPGGMHEPHNDLCAQEAVADIRDWLEVHQGTL